MDRNEEIVANFAQISPIMRKRLLSALDPSTSEVIKIAGMEIPKEIEYVGIWGFC